MGAEDLYSKAKNLYGDGTDIDQDKARRIIEYADDAIKEFGNTNQEKKVELRSWKTEAEAVLPPGTIEELRKRAEGELLKRSYPRSKVLRNVLLIIVGLAVVLLGILGIRRGSSEKGGPVRPAPSPSSEQVATKLSCKIDRLVVGHIPGVKFAQVFVVLSVLNGGAPSIAQNYKLHINGKDFEAKILNAEGAGDFVVTPADRSQKVTFRRHDSLAEKTAAPIQPGAKAEGWLRFNIEVQGTTADFISQPGIQYVVSLDDVAGKTCAADYVMR